MSKNIHVDSAAVEKMVSDESAKNTLKLKETTVRFKQSLLDDERRRAEAIRREDLEERNRQKCIHGKDKDGNDVTYWDLVRDKAKEFNDPGGQMSYIEWSTAMMDIFQAFTYLAKAHYYNSTLSKGLGDLYDNTVKMAWHKAVGKRALGQALESNLYSVKETPRMLGRGLLKLFGKEGPLPESLNYDVTIDENGKLSTSLKTDGKLAPLALEQMFDTGLVAWLQIKHGCQFDPATQKVTDRDGNLLTAAQIQDMAHDNENGLNHFFSTRENIEVESTLSSIPTPRP
ncbi:hypothetical protein [Legionella sp. CNM-4043-24]|uniref:hypothetical protein n=1 Tax=Legionella sp. CNM-4043-24 TaxID=3421646 RepID=UPI00403A7CDE